MQRNRLQRNVTLLLGLFGLAVVVINFVISVLIRGDGVVYTLSHISFLLPLFFTVLLFITARLWPVLVRYIHILLLVATSAMGILDEYDSFYGIGFAILALILSYKYGFLNRGIRWKVPAAILALIVFVEYSSVNHSPEQKGIALDALIFIVFFIALIFLIYREEIEHLISTNKNLEKTMTELLSERDVLEQAKSELEEKIRINTDAMTARARYEDQQSRMISYEDEIFAALKKKYGLTRKELEHLRELDKHGKSNKELGRQSGTTEGTVKFHLYNASGKMNVRGRTELMATVQQFKADYIAALDRKGPGK